MKRQLLILLTALCMMLMLFGCSEKEEQAQETIQKNCVYCGAPATTTLQMPEAALRLEGISIDDCEQVNPLQYAAPVCAECGDMPVHKVEPSPWE